MNSKVIIATKNAGKAKEFKSLFYEYGVDVLTLLDIPNAPDIEETGTSFEENAKLKAEGISKITNVMVIADDSGLVVDELDGAPGVYSARYAGEQKDDEANINKVLDEMKDVPEEKRTARFFCVLAIASPNHETITVTGTCEGTILYERKGKNGFGYDPIFFSKELNKSMGEMSSIEKNEISHRAMALKKLKPILEDLLLERG